MSDAFWMAFFGVLTTLIVGWFKFRTDREQLSRQTTTLVTKAEETQRKVEKVGEASERAGHAAVKAYVEANDLNRKIAELRADYNGLLAAHGKRIDANSEKLEVLRLEFHQATQLRKEANDQRKSNDAT